jgi:proteasome assembly chaperone (PAC2) family protein
MTFFMREKTFQFPPLATFICSVPSFGNVGQLATDVILSTLYAKGETLMLYIYAPLVMPHLCTYMYEYEYMIRKCL